MKPIHAKPQSGRTIEPGLALRIVSKRGQTVMFGQTGLLFANRQWGNLTISSSLNFGYFNYPLLFPNKSVCAVLTHMNNHHVVYHAAIYLDSKSHCALYGEKSFDTDTQFYIIAIGY